jgi:predicted lysophospholipase L1 biosynthesis ABC-type transport system permease subunit
MMERSSKFLSLSGWAGIMAGIYALAGAFIAYKYLGYTEEIIHPPADSVNLSPGLD